MSSLKNLILSICVLYVLQFVLLHLAPEKFKKPIKLSMAIVILTITLTKLTGIDNMKLFDGISSPDDSYTYDEADKLVLRELEAQIADYLSNALSSSAITAQKVAIEATIDSDRCISITKAMITLNTIDRDKQAQAIYITQNLIGDIDVEITYSEE